MLWPKRQQHTLPSEERIPDMIANAARLRADIHLMFLDEQVVPSLSWFFVCLSQCIVWL